MRERLFVKLSTIVVRIISKSFEVLASKVTQKHSNSLNAYFPDLCVEGENLSSQ